MNFTIFDEESAATLANAIRPPPRPLGFKSFCHTMRLPDGPHEGEFFMPESEPAQRAIADAVEEGYRIIVFVAPSQRGKTTISILAPTLYAIAQEGLAVGYVMPNLDKLEQNWAGKIKPAVVGSGFGEWLPAEGPGSKGGRPAALTMTNPTTGKKCILYFMASGTGSRETSLSSVSPGRLAIDEADDFENAGQIELALKRLESWGKKGRAFIASTVNNRGEREDHPVLDFHGRADATASRLAHRCPHCGKRQIIQFDQLNLENGRISCAHCGVLWSEDDRHAALDDAVVAHAGACKDGVVVNPTTKKPIFSLLTTCFDYHMGDFSTVAPTYIAARDKEKLGDYSLMENFKHKVLCEAYTMPVDHETVTDRMLTLKSSKSPFGRGVVPPDCNRIVVGVDVQGDRIYWVVVGAGSNNRRWIIDNDEWFWSPRDPTTGRTVEPTDSDRHAVLDRLLGRARDGWARPDGSIVRASLLAIDIGFNPGGSIGRWCFGKAGVVAVRGDHENRQSVETLQGKQFANLGKHNSTLVADHGLFEMRKQEYAPQQPGTWWFIRSQSMREHVAARLRLGYDAEGSMMIYAGLAEKDYLTQHLSAWAIVREADSKATKWVQIRRRDDYADATNYATALLSQEPQQRRSGAAGSISS